ncbi:MAG: hypothetical protein IKZ01_01260 [Anaerotignum sp.]|nr:hypothetical protein [Anaerotignum sp.]MBR5121936.1 hypothetical protein [Anaerotignum sp.]
MDGSTKFLPENDVQQMFELQGRVYAAEVYIRSVTFPERDVLLAMLGAEPDEVTRLKQRLEEKEKELENAYEAIKDMEEFNCLLEDDDPLGFVCKNPDEDDGDFLFDDDDLIADSEFQCEEAVQDEE